MAGSAKQSRVPPRKDSGLLRFRLRSSADKSLAMMEGVAAASLPICASSNSQPPSRTQPRVLAAGFAQAMLILVPLQTEGAGKAGRGLAPVIRAPGKCTRVGPQAQPEHPGLPCATVYGLLRDLPVRRTLLPPSPRRFSGAHAGWRERPPRDLTPASGARTTRLYFERQ